MVKCISVGVYMKDFPFFTTPAGVASITLSQIPYTGKAYITIQDSAEPNKLLKECCDFCNAAGASVVYASGHDCLENYPLHTEIILMRALREDFKITDADLISVTDQTLSSFCEIYNAGMKNVPNAAYMSGSEGKKMLSEGKGYFVYRDGEMLGIGIAGGTRIDAIVSLVPGCGKDVLLTLNSALSDVYAEVEVATSNIPAIRLYEKMGFVLYQHISKWYRII